MERAEFAQNGCNRFSRRSLFLARRQGCCRVLEAENMIFFGRLSTGICFPKRHVRYSQSLPLHEKIERVKNRLHPCANSTLFTVYLRLTGLSMADGKTTQQGTPYRPHTLACCCDGVRMYRRGNVCGLGILRKKRRHASEMRCTR